MLQKLLPRRSPAKKILPKLILLLSILLLALICLFINYFFKVEKIVIDGADQKMVIFGLQNIKETNLLLTSEDKIAKVILQYNPMVKTATVRKKFPREILINLKLYQPLAYFKLNGGFALLSSDGKIIDKKRNKKESLSLINYYQTFDYSQVTTGEFLDFKDIRWTLSFLEKAQELDLKIDSIDINGLSMIVFNLNQKKIIFTTDKKKEEQIYELKSIIKQFKIEARNFTVIDLRFEKPIIRF